jgi:hypothetical protein
LMLGLLAFSPLPQSNDVVMQVEAGVGGWYRGGQWIPLQVLVESQTTTIEGHLRVRVDRSSGAAVQFETTYSTPFTIAEGGSKRVFLYASLDDFSREVQVELVDQRGRVVTSQQTQIQQLDYADILYVVVTDSPTGVLDVAQHPIGRGDSYRVRWRIPDIPPKADALAAIDTLVFTDVDTGELSADQRQAIAGWVASGGHLVVTGGTNWQRTTSGLSDLLPTVPTETITLDTIAALGKFLRRPDEALEIETLVTANTPYEDALVLLRAEDTPLLVRGRYGNGTVDFTAFDATTEPLRSWDDLPYLWQELEFSMDSRPSWSYGIERFDLARDAASNVTGFDLPSVLQLLAFLFAYIALMGPLNYLFLNAIGRREFAWFTIPILIVAFTAFAYFTGFSVRGDDVTVNQVSMIQIWDGVEYARVDGVVGILAPRRTSYDVIMQDGLSLRTMPNVDETLGANQITIVEGEQYLAEDIPVDAAIMTSFATSGYIDAPLLAGQATWTLVGGEIGSTLEGEVTNGLDVTLEDAIILANDAFYQLGDLVVGASESFQFILPLDQPQRLTLGSRVDPTHPVLTPGYYRTRSLSELCYMSDGINVVYTSLMSGQDLQCFGGVDDDKLRLRRRAQLLAAVNNEIDRAGGRSSHVYLLGWSENPPLDVEMPNTGQELDGSVLYIYEIPTTIQYAMPQQATIPAGFFTWSLIEQDVVNRLPEVNPDLSFQLIGEQGVAIRFTPLDNISLAEVAELTIQVDWRLGGEALRLALWNWEIQTWEDIEFVEPEQTEFIIRDPVAYLGPQNAVQVLVESNSGTAYQSVDGIAVAMRGTSEER